MQEQRECRPYLEELNDVEVLDFGDRRADSGQHAPDDCKGLFSLVGGERGTRHTKSNF
jgi:hypothetical protein